MSAERLIVAASQEQPEARSPQVSAVPRVRTRMAGPRRRQQILDAATVLIGERGFWGLSMQDVADACQITVPGLLHHMGSKDDLLICVLQHRDEQDTAALAAELGLTVEALMAGEAVERLSMQRICAAIVRNNARRPELVRLATVLEAEALSPTHPAHDFFTTRKANTLASWTAAFASLTADPAALARQALALMDGLQLQWLSAPAGTDLVAEWEKAAAVLFAPSMSSSAEQDDERNEQQNGEPL